MSSHFQYYKCRRCYRRYHLIIQITLAITAAQYRRTTFAENIFAEFTPIPWRPGDAYDWGEVVLVGLIELIFFTRVAADEIIGTVRIENRFNWISSFRYHDLQRQSVVLLQSGIKLIAQAQIERQRWKRSPLILQIKRMVSVAKILDTSDRLEA